MSKYKVGGKCGRWTFLKEAELLEGYKEKVVLCRCDCGVERLIRVSSLAGKNPRSTSCGCYNKEVISGVKKPLDVGSKWGMLTVTGEAVQNSDSKEYYYPVKCDCGSEEKLVRVNSLKSGVTISCGCYGLSILKNSDGNPTHGMSNTPIYYIWNSMRQRCENPNAVGYENYGGRGIKVCDEWLIFENFFADMGHRPEGMSIERIDVNGNYCKENCIWADKTQQCFNRRKFKNKSSQYVGVSLNSATGKWSSEIKKNHVYRNLGTFVSEIEAAQAYDRACIEWYGVTKNFPLEDYLKEK